MKPPKRRCKATSLQRPFMETFSTHSYRARLILRRGLIPPCNHSRLTPLQRLLRLISEGIVTRFPPPSARYYTRGTVDPLEGWSSRSCNLAQTPSSALKLSPTFRELYIYPRNTWRRRSPPNHLVHLLFYFAHPRLLFRHQCRSFFLTS